MKRIALILIMKFLSISMLCGVVDTQNATTDGYITIKADGSIDPPTAPIFTTDNVTYTFTDNINGSIKVLRSNTIIDGDGYTLQPFTSPSYEGFLLHYVSNVTITNMNIRNFGTAGVSLYETSGSTVNGNNINTSSGIILGESFNNTILVNNITARYHQGIVLFQSQNNKICRNTITATNVTGNRVTVTRTGILLAFSSNNNSLGTNNITHCEKGILLSDSSGNVLRNNTMSNNNFNFLVEDGLINNVDTSNTVDGKPIYYFINRQDMVVPTNAGFVALVNCTRMIVQKLTFVSHNKPGILFSWTTNSTISKNNMTGPGNGIRLYQCSNNSIFENDITTDIHLENSSNNRIFKNNMVYGEIYLRKSSRNTVFRNTITRSEKGIHLSNSSKNVLSANNISKCEEGISLYFNCNNNTLSGNFIKIGNLTGIHLIESSHNIIYENNIEANNQSGILVEAWSSNNIISENNITNNDIGIWLAMCPNNTIYRNNFVNNTQQVDIYISCGINFWDNGIEGNYWSNYEERYPNASEVNNLGIWNTPYVIDEDNQDNYPLIEPIPEFPSFLILPLFMIATLLVVIVYRRKHAE